MSAINLPSEDESREYVRIADEAGPAILSRGRLAEESGRIPEESLRDLEPLLAMVAPVEWGGGGANLSTFLEVTRALARYCPATAWTVGFLIEHNGQLARYPQELVTTIRGQRAYVPMAATQAGTGTAERVAGGYRLTGRWRYATAVLHSDWIWVTGFDTTEQGLLRFFLPVSDVTVHDTWHMSGMRATGSHDVSVSDVFVPGHLVLHNDTARSAADETSVPYDTDFVRYSTVAAVGMLLPSIAVGAAEGVLRMYQQAADTRKAPFSSVPLAQSPAAQLRFAGALSALATARAALRDGIDAVVDSYKQVGELDGDATVQLKLHAGRAAYAASDAVDLVMRGLGASAFAIDNPLQRFRRDVDVLRGHVTLDEDWVLATVGQTILTGGSPNSLLKGFV